MNEEWLYYTEEEFAWLEANVELGNNIPFMGKTIIWVDFDYRRILIADPDIICC